MTDAAALLSMASGPSLFRPARAVLRGLVADATYWTSWLRGTPSAAEDLHWVIIATLPNSGSTALAKLLSSAPRVSLLTGNGEGQWLLPDLARPARRWQADHPVNYDRLRHVWTRAALRGADRPGLVVEKSPSNLVRLGQIVNALGGPGRVSLLSLSRDPVAICASWARRYSRKVIAEEWLGHAPRDWDDDLAFHEALGALCGARMALLAGAAQGARLALRYEDVTEDTAGTARRIALAFPEAGDVDAGAVVDVKDYKTQPLRNMNAEQIGRLTEKQIAAIQRGLAPFSDSLAALGYPTDSGSEPS